MRNYIFIPVILVMFNLTAKSQTIKQNSGWLFLLNSTKLNARWGAHFDVQLRSQDKWDGVKNVLVRPGITYFINNNNDLTLGYLFTETYNSVAGVADNSSIEHRIWQQYIHKHKISSINVSHRFRLEQRFMEKSGAEDYFAQRLRYFVRALIPLQKTGQSFDKGLFAALQDELFFNIQNKDELNGNLFDQNRAYFALGYRINKKLDLETGYMNQAVKGAAGNTNNSIVQLAIYTRF